jgi:tape measure domain-containing protein
MGVINKGGALYFASGIDNTGMHRDADETKRIVGGITDQVKRAGMVIGAVFGAQTLAQFTRQIVDVRGEMQMLESSFEVLLRGKGVKPFLDDIKAFAVESPLSLTGVSQAAQTLLGFNVAAEDTIPIIKQIGDISMGNEERFKSLTLAFAQMSSTGKLMGQDLNQMINAGFNPLQEISAKTGRSISELKKEMEKGAVSSDMVADAFKSATAEGGKFYGMTQKQAEGIKGLQAQIEGAAQEMFNDLGKMSEGFITGTYKATKSLIENYDKIGRALGTIITTYGAYRAAIIAITIAENGWTIAQIAQYKWLVLVEKAQKLLNATMLKNPYVAITVAVVGLVSVLVALKDRTTDAEKAQKKINEALQEASEKKEGLKTKGNELIGVLKDETATVYQQIKAYRELIDLLPGLKGKSLAEIQSMDSGELTKMLNQKADEDEKATFQKGYDEAMQRVASLERAIRFAKESYSKDDDAKIKGWTKDLNQAKIVAEEYKNKLEEIKELEEAAKNAQSQNTDTAIVKNKEYWKSVLDEATSARDKLDVADIGSEEWKRLTGLINSATKQLENYSTRLKEVKDDSNKLAPRDVGTVEGVGAGILESFMSSAVIDDVAGRQMGEYAEKLREGLSAVTLEGVDIFDILTSELWNKAFSNLDKMAVDDMIDLIHQLELHWNKLNLDPAELAALRERIEKITDEIGNKNPFKGLSEAIRKFKSGDGDFKDIAKNAGASLDQVGSIFNSITDGLAKMGAAGDEETQKMLKGIDDMIGGAATLAKGIASGNPADIVAGSVQLLTAAIDVFDKKSRDANRTIKKNQESVERLEKAYEKLERAISKTYSTKAAALIEDEQRNLEQQRRLIQDNIRAEQSKKKPDNKVINEWKNLLNDINVRIDENKDRILESLAGTDVMSAIDEFAQAYADAWAYGESAAKKSAEVVKGILRGALINYMKGQLQPEVDALMKKIASSMQNDGRIDTAEQKAIDALLASLDNKAAQYEKALDPYLDKETKRSGVTGELQAQMTEGTGSQLVGLWNMAAMDTREIKDHLKNNPFPNVSKDLYAIQNELAEIKQNTRETADNTDGIKEQFDEMNEKLENIEKNTKQNNSRG